MLTKQNVVNTGKQGAVNMKRNLTITILLVLTAMLLAEDIIIESYVDKTKIGLQDQLKYTIEFSGEKAGEIATPDIPEIDNFRNMGVSSSSSSSYSIVNGKMTSKIRKSFAYILQPERTGNYIIPPITLKVKGKTFTTQPIFIKVVAGTTEPLPKTSRQLSRNDTSGKLEDNLFVLAEVDKKNIYKGEPITVEFSLYTRYDPYDINDLSFSSEPVFNGFWNEISFRAKRIGFSSAMLNEQRYHKMPLIRIVLIPTRTGKLEITSLEMLVDVRIQSTSFFDFGSTKRYSIKSKPIYINVKELPYENHPEGFSGAVGKYTLSSSVSDTELKIGDSFTYNLSIKGTGNLKQFEVPALPEIKNLRFLDPEISTKINSDKKTGTKSIKYLVIAQEKGVFNIPPISFSYFDPYQKKYIIKQTREYTLNVQEGDMTFISSSAAQSSVEREGDDIGFIITNIKLKDNPIYFDEFGYWLIWLLFILLLLVSYIYANERQKLSGNLDYQRQKQANKILRKYMKTAADHAGKGHIEFYSAAQLGLSSYLADKLKIPRGSSTDQLLTEVQKKTDSSAISEKISSLLEKCDQSRFMPGGFSSNNIENDFIFMKEIIADISKTKI
jgi:hypothetical protein